MKKLQLFYFLFYSDFLVIKKNLELIFIYLFFHIFACNSFGAFFLFGYEKKIRAVFLFFCFFCFFSFCWNFFFGLSIDQYSKPLLVYNKSMTLEEFRKFYERISKIF